MLLLKSGRPAGEVIRLHRLDEVVNEGFEVANRLIILNDLWDIILHPLDMPPVAVGQLGEWDGSPSDCNSKITFPRLEWLKGKPILLKKNLSEDDTSAKFISPALYLAGWLETAIRRQVAFTAGRIIVRGRLVTRGKSKRVDYVLYVNEFPIALIEAKHFFLAAGDGMQQALEYAEMLRIPFVFSSNGRGFVFHDRTGNEAQLETTLEINAFPSPDELWSRYVAWKGLTPTQEKIVQQPYFDDGSGKEPRYYQRNAVNAAVEAIAKGQNRVLLVMATGTGKTYTAFQIIWRLWKAGQKKRILFLADRNILIDQTMVNDFRPFGGAMATGDGAQAEALARRHILDAADFMIERLQTERVTAS